MVPKILNSWLVNQHSNEDQTTVGMKLKGEEWYFCSVYNPYSNDPRKPAINSFFKETVRYYNDKKIKLVVGMDANAHSTAWGSTNDNSRGRQLLAIINELSLNIENRGKTPTFHNENRNEVLDITLTNLEASNKVANWKVMEEVDSKADHNYIKYAINKKIEIENEIPKRNLRKMNKSVYADYIEEKLAETSELENMNIEEKNLFLVTVMEEAIDASCPLIRPNKKVNKPWWDKELGIQNEELNKLK